MPHYDPPAISFGCEQRRSAASKVSNRQSCSLMSLDELLARYGRKRHSHASAKQRCGGPSGLCSGELVVNAPRSGEPSNAVEERGESGLHASFAVARELGRCGFRAGDPSSSNESARTGDLTNELAFALLAIAAQLRRSTECITLEARSAERLEISSLRICTSAISSLRNCNSASHLAASELRSLQARHGIW